MRVKEDQTSDREGAISTPHSAEKARMEPGRGLFDHSSRILELARENRNSLIRTRVTSKKH